MNYSVAKRKNFELVHRGRSSQFSKILKEIKTLSPDAAIIIEPTNTESQREIYNRMKSNVGKWKERHGLKHVSVHLTKDGKVALYRESARR